MGFRWPLAIDAGEQLGEVTHYWLGSKTKQTFRFKINIDIGCCCFLEYGQVRSPRITNTNCKQTSFTTSMPKLKHEFWKMKRFEGADA